MKITCPICGTEYVDRIRFCKVCMYSLCTDIFLNELLSHPSKEDLEFYNNGIEEYKSLWQAKVAYLIEYQSPTPQQNVHGVENEMVKVEGGTYILRSRFGYVNLNPPQRVMVNSFLIGKYPVTQELWDIIMGNNSSKFKGPRRPVENISWYDAVEFCNKLSSEEGLHNAYSGGGENIICNFETDGYRLPTEAEWQIAARGGWKSNKTKYSGSNKIKEVAWYDGNSGNETHNVGLQKPNDLGLYDMCGNVQEWCWNSFWNYSSGCESYARVSSVASSRVTRGGSWYDIAEDCRISYRYGYTPQFKSDILGFRLVRSIC